MGDTPVGRTWDRCVLLTTDLRHHSNNRRAMMMFQTAGNDDNPTLGPCECGGGFSAKCTLTPETRSPLERNMAFWTQA